MFTRGVSPTTLGLFRGFGAIAGIGATFVAPKMMEKFGIPKSGITFVFFQDVLLVFALLTFFLNSPAAPYLFLFTVVISRMGLWGFDLAEVQIMQISIEPEKRGVINSVESSLTSLATLISFSLGILISKPDDFFWLALISFACVSIAVIFFSIWCFKYQKEPLYLPKHLQPPPVREMEEMIEEKHEEDDDELSEDNLKMIKKPNTVSINQIFSEEDWKSENSQVKVEEQESNNK